MKRSVLLIGDSNTKNIVFGSGAGKVGETYPGHRVKAAKIEHIEPAACIGYTNVIIACGTNNLRPENLRSDEDIHHLVNTLHEKISAIKHLCPNSKIFVMPVMPTRIPRMNRHIILFNNLAHSMLRKCFDNVAFPGIYEFLDDKGLLSSALTRNGDDIHLGTRGLAKFVRLFTTLIFQREKSERVHMSSPSSNRNRGPPPAPS